MTHEHVGASRPKMAQRGAESGIVEAAGIEPAPGNAVTGSGSGEITRSPQPKGAQMGASELGPGGLELVEVDGLIIEGEADNARRAMAVVAFLVLALGGAVIGLGLWAWWRWA